MKTHSTKSKHLCYLAFFFMMTTSIALFLNACEDSTVSSIVNNEDTALITPLIDSNTNWLIACAEDSDCEQGGMCSCGACVIPCQSDIGCRRDPNDERAPRVDCRDSLSVLSDNECGGELMLTTEQLCIPQCEQNSECPATFECREGHCVPPPRMRDEMCEDMCRNNGRDPRRCYVECERARRDRDEAEHHEMMSMPMPMERPGE